MANLPGMAHAERRESGIFAMAQEQRRIAADYGAESFVLSITREVDGEVTEFLSVAGIIGSENLWLYVAPFFEKPGGIVYLPAGQVEWRCLHHGQPAAWLPLDSVRTQDHPGFQEVAWLKVQQDCAFRVSRRNRAGNYYYINPFSPGAPFVSSE